MEDGKKCILLVRVSTEAQDYEAQLLQLKKKAIYDGYADGNIIEIANKESAIKLSESEMMGLNEMKQLIEKDDSINCIYVWEISRISRQLDVIFNIIKYLKKKHINLSILDNNLSMYLLDGSENPTFNMFAAMFGSLAESEMKLKKERFKRGKDMLKKQNKYTGGPILYGYQVDKEKNIVEDKQAADNVRLMFELYASQEYSIKKLVVELEDRGLKLGTTEYLAAHRLTIMLSEHRYIGEYNGKGYHYQSIISKKLWNKCREVAQNNRVGPKKVTKYVSLFSLVLTCPKCGIHYVGIPSNNRYVCPYCKDSITMSILHDTLYCVAQAWAYNYMMLGLQEKSNDNKEKIKELEKKIEIAKNKITVNEKKIDKINHDIYVIGTLNSEKGYVLMAELNELIKKEQAKMKKLIEEKEIMGIQDKHVDNDPMMNSISASEVYNYGISDELKQTLIRQVIKEVIVEKKSRFNYRFIIIPTDPVLNDGKEKMVIDLNTRSKIQQVIE